MLKNFVAARYGIRLYPALTFYKGSTMKKLFVCALLFGLLASVPAFAQKTYVNGIDSNYPPFAYVDERPASLPVLTWMP